MYERLRNAEDMIRELLRLNDEAESHDTSVTIDDAFDDDLEIRWQRLKKRMIEHLAQNRPS